MKRKVIVLGAGGFVGRHIVDHLTKSSWASPVAVYRKPPKHVSHQQLPSTIIDATDHEQLRKAAEGSDFIVNCVTGKRPTITDNAIALARLKELRPDIKVVHLSSMAVYGPAEGELTETSPLLARSDDYSKDKAFSDQLMQDCEAIVMRPGIIYGTGSRLWTNRVATLLSSRRLGDLGAAGDGFCNLVYVNDVAFAIEQALLIDTARSRKVFNLAAPNPPTWNEYFSAYARSMGYVPVKRISARKLWVETKIYAVPLKAAELITDKLGPSSFNLPEPIAPSQLELFKQRIRLNSDTATNALNIDWTGLPSALTQIQSNRSAPLKA